MPSGDILRNAGSSLTRVMNESAMGDIYWYYRLDFAFIGAGRLVFPPAIKCPPPKLPHAALDTPPEGDMSFRSLNINTHHTRLTARLPYRPLLPPLYARLLFANAHTHLAIYAAVLALYFTATIFHFYFYFKCILQVALFSPILSSISLHLGMQFHWHWHFLFPIHSLISLFFIFIFIAFDIYNFFIWWLIYD